LKKKTWFVFLCLCIALSIIFLVFDYTWTLGYLFGCFISFVVYKNTERFVNNSVKARMPIGAASHFVLNFLLWGISLIICAKVPQILNILTCALGLMAIRLSIIIDYCFLERK